jgi:hypothetical protein
MKPFRPIVPANEARGPYVHTATGVVALCRYLPANMLRPDQIITRPNKRKAE